MTAASLRVDTPEQIVGNSSALRRAVASADRFAPTSLSVLIVGETGTGKELIARRIHRMSGRAGELLDVNCASLRPELAESVLFGHRRGSFTGAFDNTEGIVSRAGGGTLFLDEVNSLDMAVQATMLRVLESGEFRRLGDTNKRKVDLRVISAGHNDILDSISGRNFRRDLYHRIATVVIVIAPLRERPEDLESLATHFARVHGASLSREFMRCLTRYDWPGNVRELRAFIERAVVGGDGAVLNAADFDEARSYSGANEKANSSEAAWLREICEQAGANVAVAAELSGIPRSTLYRKLRRHGILITRPEYKGCSPQA